ncbi:MAG TPA: hypothetical protein VGM39_00345, partial [Kofleriaceae bacterium]
AAVWVQAKAEAEARQAADDAKAKADSETAKTDAEIKAKAEAFARAKAEADAKAQADTDAKAKAEAETKAKLDAELKAKTDAEAKAKADAAAAEAEAKAKAEADIKAKADAFAKATADAAAKERAAAQAKLDAAKANADEEAGLQQALAEEEARRKREEAAEAEDVTLRAETANIARKTAAARADFLEKQAREEAELVAKVAATRKSVEILPVTVSAEASGATSGAPSGPVPKPMADHGSLPPGASPDPDGDMSEEEMWAMVEARARAAAADNETRPVPKIDADELVRELKGGLRVTELQQAGVPAVPRTLTPGQTPNPVKPQVVKGDKLTVEESPTATVVVQEVMSVRHTEKTAHLTSTTTATITEAPRSALSSGAPTQVADEPSDGIVREVPTVETAPQRRPAPGVPDDADRPEARTGEIVMSRTRTGDQVRPGSQPSILVDEGSSILVGDLHAAQSAIAAVAAAQANVQATTNLAASAFEKPVAEARTDAVAAVDSTSARMLFTDVEEEFFRAGKEKEKETKFTMTGTVEKFDDLDEDYQPVGFWDRLRGKKPEPEKK